MPHNLVQFIVVRLPLNYFLITLCGKCVAKVNVILLMNFKVFYQNVRGLKTKSVDFMRSVISNDYDVIVLTETWLNEDISSSELFDDRYCVYRDDRDFAATSKRDGGGCIIAIKAKYCSVRIDEFELNGEDLWLSIDNVCNQKLFLNVRYVPCKSKLDVYKKHFDKISDIITSAQREICFVW